MVKHFVIPLLLYMCSHGYCQLLTANETVKNYNVAQKQLLVMSTAIFINLLTQNNLDRDSVVLVACKITGLPFLIAYHSDDQSPSVADNLINDGKILEAIQMLKGLNGENRRHLLAKLAMWHLYKAGEHKADLDSANYYIQKALEGSTANYKELRYECLILRGEYYRQSGDEVESKRTFFQVAKESEQEGNKKIAALAWYHLGKLHTDIDSVDLTHLNKSLALYRQLQSKEKEIEVLWEIFRYHVTNDKKQLRDDLALILQRQHSIAYQHSLYAEYYLSWSNVIEAKFLDGVEHGIAALENMKWSGMAELEAAFYTRVGVAYDYLGSSDEALALYKKALENRSEGTHIFWYKTLFYVVPLLVDLNRTEEALSLMQDVTREFPARTLWEKGQVLTTTGACYRKLNNYKLAEENFMSFLKLIDENPDMDRFGEFETDYWEIAHYYLARSNVKAASLFANKATPRGAVSLARRYHLLFKIDSISGNYKSAIDNYGLYRIYDDSAKATQQKEMFAVAQKNNEIKLLQKDKALQSTMLLQAKYTRNWILGGVALLLIIVGLLIYSSRIKQRTNKKLESQQKEIEKQNVELRHLVTEKDWLVKEIHHRVKNNLQTITSLLDTQSEYLKNEAAISAINDSQRRIQSMSLIHQKLYQTDNLSSINMSTYINELVDSLRESFSKSHHIRFSLDVEPIEFDLAHCIPVGLILNEAITNSFKYAFPTSEKGLILISLKQKPGNQIVLTVGDNGTGLPATFKNDQSDSMGMNLIRGLSKELGAQLRIDSQPGTQIMVSFEYESDMDVKIQQTTGNTIQMI